MIYGKKRVTISEKNKYKREVDINKQGRLCGKKVTML